MKSFFGIALMAILMSCGGGGGSNASSGSSGSSGSGGSGSSGSAAVTGNFAGQVDPVQTK